MPGRGRPTKRPGVRMDQILKLRIADDTLASIRAAAAKSGESVSDWVRRVLIRAARTG